jgi:hypothetical protein
MNKVQRITQKEQVITKERWKEWAKEAKRRESASLTLEQRAMTFSRPHRERPSSSPSFLYLR